MEGISARLWARNHVCDEVLSKDNPGREPRQLVQLERVVEEQRARQAERLRWRHALPAEAREEGALEEDCPDEVAGGVARLVAAGAEPTDWDWR